MLLEPYFRPARVLALMEGVILAYIAADLLVFDGTSEVFKDGASIEMMSAVLYVAAAGMLLVLARFADAPVPWHLPAILILMTLREFDLDKALTSEGVLQLRLYSGPSPWWEKLAGAAVIVLILICAWRLLTRSVPVWWRGLRAMDPVSWLVLGAGVALIVSKSLDGLARKLAPLGISVSDTVGHYAGRAEEALEMGVGMMLVMAIAFYGHRLLVPGAPHRPDHQLRRT